MSDKLNEAASALTARLKGAVLGGTAKFVVPGEGAVMVDSTGARPGDDSADVVLTASAETFQALVDGSMDPSAAFMSGKLEIDGDMALAIELAGALGG
ncbi:sterol carrier family protein [Pelagivirga sediminicola]|uniref:Sterol carrier family protein n=1 Tax=Pelagivirga sediminicola TaxID=2170575 RepID=A0A2T7GBY3_9RHOB|nr:SCP2 sterol-binding domain-containing protein [Pelagivirga sediminicola]PVA11940.1 sterol carrier family protein [Pelagivirga sediminicola]